jgi:hypothetical protein
LQTIDKALTLLDMIARPVRQLVAITYSSVVRRDKRSIGDELTRVRGIGEAAGDEARAVPRSGESDRARGRWVGGVDDIHEQHQGSVSLWFAVLAVSAALFAAIAVGVGRLRANSTMRLAAPIGIAAAVVQTIGLSRWPLLVPHFASDAASANPATVAAAEANFDTANTLLGTVLGETLGYTLTAAWTVLVVKSLGTRFSGRVFAALGGVSAGMIVLGVLSPLDLAAVDTVNFAGYVLWSIWLIWLAVVLLRTARVSSPEPSSDRHAARASLPV